MKFFFKKKLVCFLFFFSLSILILFDTDLQPPKLFHYVCEKHVVNFMRQKPEGKSQHGNKTTGQFQENGRGGTARKFYFFEIFQSSNITTGSTPKYPKTGIIKKHLFIYFQYIHMYLNVFEQQKRHKCFLRPSLPPPPHALGVIVCRPQRSEQQRRKRKHFGYFWNRQ